MIFQTIKKLIPSKTRLHLRLVARFFSDLFSLRYFSIDNKTFYTGSTYAFTWKQSQEIKKTETSQNKIQNIMLSSQKINGLCLRPGKIFSFWKTVGPPNAKNGFVEGRAIKQQVLQKEVGGGLCQLSGLFYLFALESGLQVIERHSHSVDIYKESERFSPLGSDATIVYGYKDLQFKNSLNTDIVFFVDVKRDRLSLEARTENRIDRYNIIFDRTSETKKQVTVQTYRQKDSESSLHEKEYIGESVYDKLAMN